MKNSLRQTILAIIFIVIFLIPTYIAITYFAVKSGEGNRYSLEITSHTGEAIDPDNDTDAVARAVLKMNSKMKSTNNVDINTLPDRYYDIKVVDKGTTYDYRYYFSVEKDKNTIVMDKSGAFYVIEFKNVKSFLSRDCAYMFYDTSSMPTLSIFGGEDILPQKASWRYRAVSGSFLNHPDIKLSSDNTYAMSGHSTLSFSVPPDKYTVRVYLDRKEILRTSDLNKIPYEMLDSTTLYFIVEAEWTSSNQYRGSAEYKFYSSIAKAPEFLIDKTAVDLGGFFAVTAANVTAPQKIEFTSVPSIHFTPTFFSDGDNSYALIPIDNSKLHPMDYTFTFKYGDYVSEIKVTVSERLNKIERDYNCGGISVSRNEHISEYISLLSKIGGSSESIRYFSDKFIDYEDFYNNEITLLLGYGHKRIPSNEDSAFYLDGVDYIMDANRDVCSIGAGKVVYTGFNSLLGNFVVVDHGLGLKTWYCHLGDIITTTGNVIAKGETLGKSGKTGYTNANGVYLITTVFNVPVCPYEMQETGILFPIPEN